MVKRTREEWLGLFEEHAGSGMTERAFCEARRMCPKHFNHRKQQLGWARKEGVASVFVRVEKALPMNGSILHVAEPRVLLRLGRCEWELQGMSEDVLLRLMAALA